MDAFLHILTFISEWLVWKPMPWARKKSGPFPDRFELLRFTLTKIPWFLRHLRLSLLSSAFL